MSSTQPQPSLQQEIEELGRQLAEALRVARESPRGKQVEQQVRGALGDTEKYLNDAYAKLRAKAESPEFKSQVANTAKDAADEVSSQLALGLRALNEKIKQMLADAEKRRTGEAEKQER